MVVLETAMCASSDWEMVADFFVRRWRLVWNRPVVLHSICNYIRILPP
jgi:hypothetical protein